MQFHVVFSFALFLQLNRVLIAIRIKFIFIAACANVLMLWLFFFLRSNGVNENFYVFHTREKLFTEYVDVWVNMYRMIVLC